MRIPELYGRNGPVISLELFPPKSDEAEETLFRETVPILSGLKPSFFSVTYGAGGGTRSRTLRMAHRLRRDFGVEAMAHLTCVGSTQEDLAAVLDEAQTLGIENVLALRGDPPRGETRFNPVAGGFRYAVDLLQFIRRRGGFAAGVAGYPEGHVECPDKRLDWDRTAVKVAHGADFIISQLFYNADAFLEFAAYLRDRHGVKVPIIPGVLPFLSAEQVKRFTALCGARLPEGLRSRLERFQGDEESARQLGVEVCTDLCSRLLAHGVPGLHLYCLNRVASCSELLRNLGLVDHRAGACHDTGGSSHG